MSYAFAFAAIVIPLALWGIIDAILSHRRKMAGISRDERINQLSGEKAELTEKVTLMEDRVAVLERIATDPARRTAAAIEKLEEETRHG